MDLAIRLTRSTVVLSTNNFTVGYVNFLCSTLWPSTLMHLWFQALSRLRIPHISSLDEVFPSRLIIWRTENFSAARIIPAPNYLAYQKIRHSNDPKKSPRGVHVIYVKHVLANNSVSEQARKGFCVCVVTEWLSNGHTALLGCRYKTSTMYVVTLLALYLLDLFYERCGDITLVRRMCKHATYHGDVI